VGGGCEDKARECERHALVFVVGIPVSKIDHNTIIIISCDSKAVSKLATCIRFADYLLDIIK